MPDHGTLQDHVEDLLEEREQLLQRIHSLEAQVQQLMIVAQNVQGGVKADG